METWISRVCRGTSARQVFAWALVVLAGLAFGVSNWRYVRNFIGGPYQMGAVDLAGIQDVGTTPRYFVRVSGTQTEDTGIEEITIKTQGGRETSREVSARWVALLVGDRWLIVKTSYGMANEVEGSLLDFPTDVHSTLFGGMPKQVVADNFYPFYLEKEGFRTYGYWAIATMVLLTGLLLVYARRAWTSMNDPSRHPVADRLQHWGDPISVAAQIEDEIKNAVRYRAGTTLLTDRFLITKSFFTFNVLRFEDLVWAYKKVTKHSVNFIPTGKTFSTVLVCRGGSVELQGKEQQAAQWLEYAQSKAPWAIFGFSKEIEELFNKKSDDFLAAVEERRQKLTANR